MMVVIVETITGLTEAELKELAKGYVDKGHMNEKAAAQFAMGVPVVDQGASVDGRVQFNKVYRVHADPPPKKEPPLILHSSESGSDQTPR